MATNAPGKIGLKTAIALVVANIIGAGIFTTTGFQAADLGHPGWIFVLWVIGGLLAFCGALCFAELATMMPHAGGEYVYLRETYGRAFGFMSAFVSLTAGFSAPIAAALKGLIRYASHFFPFLAQDERLLGWLHVGDLAAVVVLWLLIAIHARGFKGGYRFNDWVTLFKVVGIVLIILAAFGSAQARWGHLVTAAPDYQSLTLFDKWAAMGTSLIFVMFCYSGWNASAYVAHEIDDPKRDIPRSLLIGTAIVVIFYIGLNAVFFLGADVHQLAGQVEVGLISARNLFGATGVSAVTIVLCVSILASASAMIIAGPRIYYAFGKDFRRLRSLASRNPDTGAPVNALILQGVMATLIIVSGRLDQIQQYAGFTLSLFSCLAVSCVIVLRFKAPEVSRAFKTWGYPWTPLVFLGISAWTMVWAFRGRPLESSVACITVVTGGFLFYILDEKPLSSPSRGPTDKD